MRTIKRKLKLLWRWLILPAPPEGKKYADNPDLPGYAPADQTPMQEVDILKMQLMVLGDKAKEFDRLNEEQKKIAKFFTSAYGQDAADGLHAQIGGDFADLIVYYLRRERLYARHLASTGGMTQLMATSFGEVGQKQGGE